MRVRIEKYGYPMGDEGLEKETKRWYEFQLIERSEREISENEYNEIVTELYCNQNGALVEETANMEVIESNCGTYTFIR
jgi:hypothetical protein